MPFAPPTIAELGAELRSRIETLNTFRRKSYTIFSSDDFSDVTQLKALPVVGITYLGGNVLTNKADPVAKGAHGATLFRLRYNVLIAVEYKAIQGEKQQAVGTDLLDELRPVLLGFKGVNNRPWRLSGEGPIPGNLEGVIFYGQLWETEIPVIGQSTNQS